MTRTTVWTDKADGGMRRRVILEHGRMTTRRERPVRMDERIVIHDTDAGAFSRQAGVQLRGIGVGSVAAFFIDEPRPIQVLAVFHAAGDKYPH